MAVTQNNTVTKVPKRILGTLLSSLSAGVVPRSGAPYIAIGRTEEIESLTTSLDRVSDGEGATKFIIGRYGSGKSFLIQLSRGYALDRGFITADCDDPVLAFRLLDFMTSQESYLRMRYGIPGEDWNWAAEGAVNAYEVPAVIDIVDSSIFASQNNKCWHETHAIIVPASMNSSSFVDDGSWGSARSKLAADIKLSQIAVGTPAEVVFKLVYTAEEQEVASAVETSLKDYIAEARAMFVSGVMDPNNDTEWETYLSNLEAQGMNDWLAVAQSAYTRMTAG